MSDVDRLLAEYVAEHRAGGEADPREYLSRASPPSGAELAALIDAYLARAPRQQFDEASFRGSTRRAHGRRARARDRRPSRALARTAAAATRPGRAEALRARRAARGGSRRERSQGQGRRLLPRDGAGPAARRKACPTGCSSALGQIVGETDTGAQRRRTRAHALRRGPRRRAGSVRAARLRRARRRPVAWRPDPSPRASGTRSTSCSAAPDVRFRPPRRPSR